MMSDPIAPAGATPVAPTPAAPTPQQAQAKKLAEEFEAVFVGAMTKLMVESVETGGEFSGGHGEAMFRGVMAEQLGTEIAKRGGIGLAPSVMDQILRLQGQGK
jgi:peptidoglycan hydrolase FlgJ